MDKLLRRYWLPIVLAVLAIAQFFGAIGSVTFWKASDTISVDLPSSARSQLVSTKDGVLSLYSTTAKLEVSGSGKVAIVIGRAADVTGWLSSTEHLEVSGLENNQVFRAEKVAPSAKNDKAPKASSSEAKVRNPLEENAQDMWVKVVTAQNGKVSLDWDRPGNWSMIAWTEKGVVSLKITWPQENTFNPFWLLLVGGALATLLAVVSALTLFKIARAIEREKEEIAQAKSRARKLQKLAEAAPLTGQIPAVTPGAKLPSRAQMRKARERGESTLTYDGVEYATGIIPQIQLDAEGKAIPPQEKAAAEEAPSLSETDSETDSSASNSARETELSFTPEREEGENEAPAAAGLESEVDSLDPEATGLEAEADGSDQEAAGLETEINEPEAEVAEPNPETTEVDIEAISEAEAATNSPEERNLEAQDLEEDDSGNSAPGASKAEDNNQVHADLKEENAEYLDADYSDSKASEADSSETIPTEAAAEAEEAWESDTPLPDSLPEEDTSSAEASEAEVTVAALVDQADIPAETATETELSAEAELSVEAETDLSAAETDISAADEAELSAADEDATSSGAEDSSAVSISPAPIDKDQPEAEDESSTENNLRAALWQKTAWETQEEAPLPDKLTEVIWAEEPEADQPTGKLNLFQRWFQQGKQDVEEDK